MTTTTYSLKQHNQSQHLQKQSSNLITLLLRYNFLNNLFSLFSSIILSRTWQNLTQMTTVVKVKYNNYDIKYNNYHQIPQSCYSNLCHPFCIKVIMTKVAQTHFVSSIWGKLKVHSLSISYFCILFKSQFLSKLSLKICMTMGIHTIKTDLAS